MDEIKKICKNCRYFSEHFFIYRDYLKSLGCGFCINGNTDYAKKRKRSFDEGCDKWEPCEIRNGERNARIENTINDMSRRLTQILQILKTDK